MSSLRRLMMSKKISDVVISDSFNRANGPIGIADTGQVWTTTRPMVIDNNSARCTDPKDTLATIDSGVTDVDITTTINFFEYAGIVFGYADTALHYRVLMSLTSNEILIRKGPYSPLKSVSIPFVRRAYKLRVVSIGGLIRVYLDDILVIEVSDSSYRSPRQGILAARANDKFDDFVVKRATPFAENVVFVANSLAILSKSLDTNILSCFPIVYGSTYKITFDYSITVTTAYDGDMVIAVRDASAFGYTLLKSVDGTVVGTYTGSVNHTITALKNAGDVLTIMFRANKGIADCTLSNVKIEKVG